MGYLSSTHRTQQNEDRLEGPINDPEYDIIAPAGNLEPTDLGRVPYEYELDSRKISNQQWFEMSLNKEQRQIDQFIVGCCAQMSMTYKTTNRPESFHIL